MIIKRGDVLLVDFEPVKGSEQGGKRPALVIQNDSGNNFSPTTIVAPITSKKFTRDFPTNVNLKQEVPNLKYGSTVLLNQIKTIDKSRIGKVISFLPDETMRKVNLAIKVSLGLD